MPRSISRTFGILMLTIAVQAVLPAQAEPDQGMRYVVPSFIQGAEPELWAEWISAERATTDDDQVEWQLIGDNVRRSYEAIRATAYEYITVRTPGSRELKYDLTETGPRPDGAYYGQSYYDYYYNPPNRTLEDQIEHAKATLLGEVIAVTPGFYEGIPHSLLSVRLDRYEGKSNRAPGYRVAHVAYPVAKFSIGDITFYKGDPRFPTTPDVGDRLLFFSYRLEVLSAETILRAEHDKLAIERTGGSVSAPEKWGLSGFNESIAAIIPAVELLMERDYEFPKLEGRVSLLSVHTKEGQVP